MESAAATGVASEGLMGLLDQARHVLVAVAKELDGLARLDTRELVAASERAAGIERLAELVMVRTVRAVEDQCRRADLGESVAACLGFRDPAALLMTVSGASRRTLTRWRQVGAVTAARGFGSTGVLPPLLPHLAHALAAGAVSIDQALVVRQHLLEAATRARPEDLDAAERALVAAAVGVPEPGEHRCDCEHSEAGSGCDCVGGCCGEDPCGEAGCGQRGCEGHAGEPMLPLPPELLAVQARAWVAAIDPDGPEPSYERQRAQRSFTLGQRSDGMWVGKLLLPPDQGTALRLALDAHNAPRAQVRYHDAHDNDSAGPQVDERDGARAEAGEGAAGLAAEASPGAGLRRNGRLDERSTGQRQADTLVGLVSRAMELSDAPRIGGEAATVVVTISQVEPDNHAATGGGIAHLEHTGEPVPAHVAARIICDGYLQACVLGEVGLPLKLGRARRAHTRHQRRAILTAYPGGCQNPGCDAPPGFTEIHHPLWWSNGGNTDTDNGVPLCQHCHTEVHAGRLRCIQDAAGRWTVVPALRFRNRVRLAA